MPRLKRIKKIRLHNEGKHILWLSLAFFVALNLLSWWLFHKSFIFFLILIASVIVYGIMVNFFRCPIRIFEGEDTENVVVAPADGKVVVIEKVQENEFFHDLRIQVSIFMNLVNVHANWYPVDGIVRKVEHKNGKFSKAWLPKASLDNERSTIVIETPGGIMVMARQIAGAVARRIVTYAKEGEECYIDEHMGFIKFGSRVDVFLPVDSEILVTMGQYTVGNQTVIAHLPH